jgi:hypothetical protein
MVSFFRNKNFTWPVYGWNEPNSYGWENSLNPEGQTFVKNLFFPAIIKYIEKERKKTNPNMTNIAVLNTAVKLIWYDYFIGDR